jgi:hypothetical protein
MSPPNRTTIGAIVISSTSPRCRKSLYPMPFVDSAVLNESLFGKTNRAKDVARFHGRDFEQWVPQGIRRVPKVSWTYGTDGNYRNLAFASNCASSANPLACDCTGPVTFPSDVRRSVFRCMLHSIRRRFCDSLPNQPASLFADMRGVLGRGLFLLLSQ